MIRATFRASIPVCSSPKHFPGHSCRFSGQKGIPIYTHKINILYGLFRGRKAGRARDVLKMDSHVVNRVEMIDYIDTLLEFADMVTVSHEVLSFSVGKNSYTFTKDFCTLGMQRFECDYVLFVFGHGTLSVICNLLNGVDITVDFPRKDRE